MAINKNIFFIMIFIALFSFVPAAQETTIYSFPEGITIVEQQQEVLKANSDYIYHFHLQNSTNGKTLNNASIACNIFMTNQTGYVTFTENIDYVGPYWEVIIPGSNLTAGEHPYGLICENDVGGSISGTFYVTQIGMDFTLSEIISYIILILTIIGIMLIINDKHSRTDFKKNKSDLVQNHKNYKTTMVKGILQSLFKNIFIWNYFLGWLLILVIDNMLSRFAYNGIYEYLTIITTVYSLGLILVVVFMIGFMIDYLKELFEDISKDNWGLS